MLYLKRTRTLGLLIFLLSCILFTNCNSDKEKVCRLTGKVVGRNSKTLVLKKKTDHSRVRKIEIEIDSSGNFEYDLRFKFVEAYEFIFADELDDGVWKPILFFPDSKKIEFTLYPMDEFQNNKIEGSKLSLEDNSYKEIINDTFYSKYVNWKHELDSMKNIGESGSKYAKQISDSISNLNKVVPIFELKYIHNNPNLYSYSRFLSVLNKEKNKKRFSIDTLRMHANYFKEKFPVHPYNEISQLRLNGLTHIQVGGEYVDFTAKDSTGASFTASDIIAKNRLTLIDLWAPWCGSCIGKSKKVVPIYEEYKDKGFEVVGVVGGINSKEKCKKAIEKYKYPWLVLSEINNENKLWEKYYVSNAGGGQFLVNNKGQILAINPSQNDLIKLIQDN